MIEVMLAATVLAFGLVASVICIQIGVRDLDVARTGTAVSQVLQNEMERLRLQDWATVSALPASETLNVATTFSSASILNGKVKVVRQVGNVADFSDMKEIVVTASWSSIDGKPHSRAYRMRYAKNGLYDYYYSSNVES